MNEDPKPTAAQPAAAAPVAPTDVDAEAKLRQIEHIDVSTVFAQVKADVGTQIDTAVAAAAKLLSAAAGDIVEGLSPAEAAAISVVVHNAPPQFAPAVQMFAASAASFEGPINAAADAAVQHGLAWALTWLTVAKNAADKALA